MSEWCFAAKMGSAQLSCADVLAHRLPLQPYPRTGARAWNACWVMVPSARSFRAQGLGPCFQKRATVEKDSLPFMFRRVQTHWFPSGLRAFESGLQEVLWP